MPFDPPSCVFRRVAGLPLVTDCRFAPDRRFMTTAQRAQDRAAAGLTVHFIDMNVQLCGGEARRVTTRSAVLSRCSLTIVA